MPPLTSLQASAEAESEVTLFTPTFQLWPKILFNKKLSGTYENFKNFNFEMFLILTKNLTKIEEVFVK